MSGATRITVDDVRLFVEVAHARCHVVLNLRRCHSGHTLAWPSVHRLVSRLQKAGLVTKRRDGNLGFSLANKREAWRRAEEFKDG